MRIHLFWPPSMIFISVIITHILHIANHAGPSVWAPNISTICQSAGKILELYIPIQIWTLQLLIFTEKFLPLPGFEPGTSPVPSRYATNWAILAWIVTKKLRNFFIWRTSWSRICEHLIICTWVVVDSKLRRVGVTTRVSLSSQVLHGRVSGWIVIDRFFYKDDV